MTPLNTLAWLFVSKMEALSSLHHLSMYSLFTCFLASGKVCLFLLYFTVVLTSNFAAVVLCLLLGWVDSGRGLKQLWFHYFQKGLGNEFLVTKLNGICHCFFLNWKVIFTLARFQVWSWNLVGCFAFNCDLCGSAYLLNLSAPHDPRTQNPRSSL